MAKRKEKQNTDLEKQRSLSAFGLGRSVSHRLGPSTSESAEGKTSLYAVLQRESPCKKKMSESTKTFQEKWTLEFPWLYRLLTISCSYPHFFSGKGMNTP